MDDISRKWKNDLTTLLDKTNDSSYKVNGYDKVLPEEMKNRIKTLETLVKEGFSDEKLHLRWNII